MGKKKGPKPPTAAEERASAKDYWDNYSSWTSDAQDRLSRNSGSIRARNAGNKKLTGLLIGEAEKTYNDRIKGIKGGEHHKALEAYRKKSAFKTIEEGKRVAFDNAQYAKAANNPFAGQGQKRLGAGAGAIDRAVYRRPSDSQPFGQGNFKASDRDYEAYTKENSFDDFYKGLFGDEQKGEDPTKEQAGATRAKRAASGRLWE